MFKFLTIRVLAAFLMVPVGLISMSASAQNGGQNGSNNQSVSGDFVKRQGRHLWLDGKRFRFAGSNNHYVRHKSTFMVDNVLETAAANDFSVMRVYGYLDIGNQDFSNSFAVTPEGVYYQYWDINTGQPAYNDGADGLQHLDYAVAKAGELGLKLVIPLTNSWGGYGGISQYIRWREAQLGAGSRIFYASDFFTDPVIVQWYKDWIAHLLNRVNIYTGVRYKDDPTIMIWELVNALRCGGGGAYPADPSCTTQTTIAWVDDISTFIKSIDSNHLVSVGDEGLYCLQNPQHWSESCEYGVDTIAFASLPNIDIMTMHVYPDVGGGTFQAWPKNWIARRIRDARRIGKPAMITDFGLHDKTQRNIAYKEWVDNVLWFGGSGALVRGLTGLDDYGSLYPDFDGFALYCPSPVCTTISNFSNQMSTRRFWWLIFDPVADHESAITEFQTPITLNPAANDTAYWFFNSVIPGSIDLDPSTPVQDTTVTVAGGTFTLAVNGVVEFVPASGFYGDVEISYTIQDYLGLISNTANIAITVKPQPAQPIQLFSFETGTDGWAAAPWNPDAGVVSKSDVFSTDGQYSLAVDIKYGGWFQVVFPAPLDLSTGYTAIDIDLLVDDASGGIWHNIALLVGNNLIQCQGPGVWIPNSTLTVTQDLLSLTCTSPTDFSEVHSMIVNFGGNGYMDNIRVW